MSETVVKKSFMDKLTGFFYKFGHYTIMIIAYIAVALLAILSGIVAGKGGFDFDNKEILPSCIVFIVSISLIGISLIFSFAKPLRKIANWFFVIIGFISMTALAILSGLVFFEKSGGDFNGSDWEITIPGTDKTVPIPAVASGSIFVIATILIGLVTVGGIAYSISMADNRKKEKELKRSQEA